MELYPWPLNGSGRKKNLIGFVDFNRPSSYGRGGISIFLSPDIVVIDDDLCGKIPDFDPEQIVIGCWGQVTYHLIQ